MTVILAVIQVIIVIPVIVLGLLGPFLEPPLLKTSLITRVSRKGIILVIPSALSIINKSRKTQNRPRSLKNPGGFNARLTRSRRKSA